MNRRTGELPEPLLVAIILTLLLTLLGCTNISSPTEPVERTLAVVPRPETCSFRVWSSTPPEHPIVWALRQADGMTWRGTMQTQGLTVGVANYAGPLTLTLDGKTSGAIVCSAPPLDSVRLVTSEGAR